MTVRILADREPYCSFGAARRDDEQRAPYGALIVLNGPAGLDDPSPDYIVLPARDFLALDPVLPSRGGYSGYIAYGPVELMEKAFEMGCADYIREPWALLELRARVGRLCRRSFQSEGMDFELKAGRLVGARASISLSDGEASLLIMLLRNAPFPIPRSAAYKALFETSGDKSHALSRCVASLRRKMNLVGPGLGTMIRTVRGFGFRAEL